ncbi:hypothetical protein BHE74_00056637 [Ensete ventricosum]|nr:hypothetical protein BHE74_00056637 [Ensete ventricosum]
MGPEPVPTICWYTGTDRTASSNGAYCWSAISNGTSLPVDWFADCSLSGGTIDWGCLLPVTARNKSVMVDFDRRRLLKGGINLAAAREKEEEEEEKGEPEDPTPLSLDDPDQSPPSLVGHYR